MAKINQAMQDLYRYNAAMVSRKRSSFNKSHSHTTTIDSAYLVPLMWDRVLPGDEKKIRYSGLARMATPIHPVMDEANLDVWAFYIPDRLWFRHAKEFYGENLNADFNPDGEYQMPSLKPSQYLTKSKTVFSAEECGIGSLNDYFGFPIAYAGIPDNIDSDPAFRATAGLHRSYQLIWNEWFRNSSIQPALQLNDGDSVTSDEWNVIKQIRKVCKYPDYFTSLLKQPQAGDDVLLPLGEWAPVVSRDVNVDPTGHSAPLKMAPLGIYPSDSYSSFPQRTLFGVAGIDTETTNAEDTVHGYGIYGSEADIVAGSAAYPKNLWADLTNATAATINNIRAAVTVQQLLEISNNAGKRYQQIIQAHFGVFTPDATLQRPQLLGSSRTPIGMRQVLQTSSTTDDSPQGNTAAFSLTNVRNEWICNNAFTEPGFIMVLGAVRTAQSYSQGLDPLLTKINLYDHYFPVFDNLGNQPVPVSSVYFTFNRPFSESVGSEYVNDPSAFKATFGYSEAWTEYRTKQNRVSGLMRPDLSGTGNEGSSPNHASLASWNYSIAFGQPPVLNSEFVTEDPQLLDRTIAVPSEPQFILDSYFDYIDVKNMGVHSIPGILKL